MMPHLCISPLLLFKLYLPLIIILLRLIPWLPLFIILSLRLGIPFFYFHCHHFLLLLLSFLRTSCHFGHVLLLLFLLIILLLLQCFLVSSLSCSSSTLSTSHIPTCFSSLSFSFASSSSCLPLPLCSFHHVLLQHAPATQKRDQNNHFAFTEKTDRAGFRPLPTHPALWANSVLC